VEFVKPIVCELISLSGAFPPLLRVEGKDKRPDDIKVKFESKNEGPEPMEAFVPHNS
jgi:hypothetical protein